MPDFKPHDAVKIHRPNKQGHGQIGRFVSLADDPAFAWVAFWKEAEARTSPPPATLLHDQRRYPRKLFPLSQIVHHEPANPKETER